MKSSDILYAVNDIDADMVEDAAGARAIKAPWRKWSALVACLCLVMAVVLAIPTVRNYFGEEPADSIFWVDDRERKDGKVLSDELAIYFSWRYLSVFQQYPQMTWEGSAYRVRTCAGQAIPLDGVGALLGEAVASGYDDAKEKEVSIPCQVYRIEGVDPARVVAVRYEGQERLYPFLSEQEPTYGTLGDMIESLNLTEHLVFDRFYRTEKEGVLYTMKTVSYGLSEEDAKGLWPLILAYADAPSVSEAQVERGKKLLGFPISSPVLGVENLSWAIYEGGYIITNILGYGCYFDIGADAVKEIVDYALDHRVKMPADTQSLVGVVTEVGDGWFKVDDSIMMKNEGEGMVFTVYADHYRVSPYLESGYLREGMIVRVTHGALPKENPGEIRNATSVEEAIVTFDGKVLIPE